MPETVYSARPALHAPGAFLRDAAADLARSLPLGRRLFAVNLRARHRRAWLGYAWLLLPPLAGVAICLLIQSRRVVEVGATELPYPLFVLSGIVLWQVFTEALLTPLGQLTGARRVLRGQRVPHEAFVIAGALDVALNAAMRLALLGVALLVFATPAWSWALVPIAAAVLAVFGLALGLLATPFGLLYDDVRRALQLAASAGVFVSPVLYPLPDAGWFALNPLGAPLDLARTWLVRPAAPDVAFLLTAALAGAMLGIAWLFYRLARPHVLARQG